MMSGSSSEAGKGAVGALEAPHGDRVLGRRPLLAVTRPRRAQGMPGEPGLGGLHGLVDRGHVGGACRPGGRTALASIDGLDVRPAAEATVAAASATGTRWSPRRCPADDADRGPRRRSRGPTSDPDGDALELPVGGPAAEARGHLGVEAGVHAGGLQLGGRAGRAALAACRVLVPDEQRPPPGSAPARGGTHQAARRRRGP